MLRYDLIQKELESGITQKCKFHKTSLSKRIINNLYNKYNLWEATIHFYDDYADIPEDLMDKEYNLTCQFNYDNLSVLEASELMAKIHQYEDEYKTTRIEFNNWIDVFGPGIWSESQEEANLHILDLLKSVKQGRHSHKDRFYIAYDRNRAYVYCYMRDVEDFLCDYWLILEKK